MARRPRVVVPGSPHNIILRGNNRRRLFSKVTDRRRMLACLEDGLAETECVLHQLTLMPNHVHMIVTPPASSSLAKLMQRSCQRYAQVRNAQRNGSGKLFEERFKSKPILDEEYLMRATLYNDANAFKAGLVANALADEWSTGPLHAGRPGSRIPVRIWIPSGWYLALGNTREARARVYTELMAAYLQTAVPVPTDRYSQRLLRPDGTSAREAALRWPLKRQ